MSRSVNLSLYLHTLPQPHFTHVLQADQIEIQVSGIVISLRMNGWLDERLILLLKKRACLHIRMIMNKMQEEDNIKNKTSQNKKRVLTPQQTCIAAKPSDNSEISGNVKVSNSTFLLIYISSFLLFSLLKREVKLNTFFGGIIVDGGMK